VTTLAALSDTTYPEFRVHHHVKYKEIMASWDSWTFDPVMVGPPPGTRVRDDDPVRSFPRISKSGASCTLELNSALGQIKVSRLKGDYSDCALATDCENPYQMLQWLVYKMKQLQDVEKTVPSRIHDALQSSGVSKDVYTVVLLYVGEFEIQELARSACVQIPA